MRMMSATALLVFCVVSTGAYAQSTYPMAGLTPDRRPEGAPTVKEFRKDQKWSENFYRGISRPFPPHIDEASQGGWYTPFNHPGMIGPYDIRRWHQSSSQPKAQTKGRRA